MSSNTSLKISKWIGSSVVVGSSMFKVPQIIRILKARSVEGLSPVTYTLEIASQASNIVFYASQGHPFSVWGEFAFIGNSYIRMFLFLSIKTGFQNVVILILYSIYRKKSNTDK